MSKFMKAGVVSEKTVEPLTNLEKEFLIHQVNFHGFQEYIFETPHFSLLEKMGYDTKEVKRAISLLLDIKYEINNFKGQVLNGK